VKEKKRVPCSESHGFLTCLGRLCQPAIFIESPGQSIPGINVMPDFKLFLREVESLGELHIMIGVEECQIAIVQHLIDVSKQSNVLDQRILLLSLCLVSRSCIEISQLRHEDRHRDDGNGLFVEHDCLRISAIVRSELTQRCQSAIVSRMDLQSGNVSSIGGSGVTNLCFILSQLVVQPCEVFTRQLSFDSLGDG